MLMRACIAEALSTLPCSIQRLWLRNPFCIIPWRHSKSHYFGSLLACRPNLLLRIRWSVWGPFNPAVTMTFPATEKLPTPGTFLPFFPNHWCDACCLLDHPFGIRSPFNRSDPSLWTRSSEYWDGNHSFPTVGKK